MDTNDDAVVVPLVPVQTELTTEAMLRMLLDREALLIQRVPATASSGTTGMVAHGAGAFAKALGRAVGPSRAARAGTDLYRLVLPSGAVARDLVPAVGGGFRGIVRGAGSSKIAGHARLVPAAGLGAGATIAAGPLIATIGLAVAGEMIAQHQINKKLDSIHRAVTGVQHHLDAQERAVLTTADQEAKKVAGYLLDQAAMPPIAGAAHAFGELASLTNKHVERLDGWSAIAEKHLGADRVNAAALLVGLVGRKDNPIKELERLVAQTYQTLALRARVIILEKVAAEFANPTKSMPHVEEVLRGELSAITDRQTQLVTLLDDLNVMQIDGSKLPVKFAGNRTLSLRTSVSRLTRAVHEAPPSLPMLSESDHTILELAPSERGLDVLKPTA